MVDINMNPETPTQAIVKAANAVVTVTDARGRSITIAKMKALDQMRLFEAVGAVNAKNDGYLGVASLAYHVTAIDGEPVMRPQNKIQLEAIVQRLDDDGFEAVAKGISDNFVPKSVTEDEAKEAIKNA